MSTAVSPRRSSSFAVLPTLQLAVPMLAAGSFFIFSDGAADLNDPQLPFAFRLGKDLLFMALVFAPVLLALFGERLLIPVPMMMYLVSPVLLMALMLVIGSAKGGSGFVPSGLVRNFVVYYVGAGAMVVFAAHRGYERWLFTVFRVMMAFSVLVGLALYAFADNLLLVTIHGRMIGTLGNPNFLGFLAVMWLVVLQGHILKSGRIDRPMLVEFGLAIVGVVASASIAAILTYAAWLAVVAALLATGQLPGSRIFRRLVLFQLVGAPVVLVGGIVTIEMLYPGLLELVGKIQSMLSGGSDTTSVRVAAYLLVFRDLTTLPVVLVGQQTTLRFIEFDGSNLSILYNFGLPLFFLWSAYFLAPVLVTARQWRILVNRLSLADALALVLAPFVAVSFAVEFWIQYVPEKYPTCLLLAWIMYFLVHHSIRSAQPNAAGAR